MTLPTFFSFASEVRLLIYHHIFLQPNGELLALSREPEHDFENGPPSDWIADSRQARLVYSSDIARLQPTNSCFLLTCRLINREATPAFYGTNKIILYAEDNNDIFSWLLDIGEHNRRAIRYLKIEWAYGVSIESGRGNIHGILEAIESMEESIEQEVQRHRQQLIHGTKAGKEDCQAHHPHPEPSCVESRPRQSSRLPAGCGRTLRRRSFQTLPGMSTHVNRMH